jgi:adenylate cyclase
VKYVLEGSAQKSSDHVRIEVELVDAASGTQMWTQRFDRPLKNIFAVQDEIVEKVVTTLGLILRQEEVKVPHWANSRQTDNVEALDDLLRAGEYAARFTKDDSLAARHWEEKAIALAPKSAGAYASLAGNYESDVLFRWSKNPEADLDHASELAHKALVLDDSNSFALMILCEIDWQKRRFDQAVAEGKRAVAIDPNFAQGYVVLSEALGVSNRVEEALHAVEKAMRLDPSRQDFYAFFIGQAYVDMGRYREAIPLLKRHLAVYPNQPWAHVALIEAYSELGDNQEARAAAAELKHINPQFAYSDINEDAARNMRYENDLRKAGLK